MRGYRHNQQAAHKAQEWEGDPAKRVGREPVTPWEMQAHEWGSFIQSTFEGLGSGKDSGGCHSSSCQAGGEKRCTPIPARPGGGGQGPATGSGRSEEGVLACAQGRGWGMVSGNQKLLPGFVLARPDPGCTSHLPLSVSQGHYLNSGNNDGGTWLTGYCGD